MKNVKVYLKNSGNTPEIEINTDIWWGETDKLNDNRTAFIELNGSVFRKSDIAKIIVTEIAEPKKEEDNEKAN